MALPGVTVSLTSVSRALNPQDVTQIPMVIGPSSLGTVAQPVQLDDHDSVRALAGYGPGAELAAEALEAAGGPVFFTRSATTTAGAVAGGLTKRPVGAGVAQDVFGIFILPGADANGRVRIQSLQEGVTLTIVQGGALAWTRSGKDLTLTVVAATTTGSDIVGLALGTAAGYISQPAHSGTSTGASVCDTVLAKTAFDLGTIAYTPLCAACYLVPGADANGGVVVTSTQSGGSVEFLGGTSKTLQVYRQGSKLTVQLGTDGGATVTSTAANVVTAIAESADAAALGMTGTATGTGLGLAAAMAVQALDAPHIAHVVSGNNTSAAVALSASTVTVTDSTGASGDATGTAATILGLFTGAPAVVMSAVIVGAASTGKVGPKSSTALVYGSTGAASLSGTPNDRYNLQVEIVRGAAVGASPAPTLRWAVDELAGTSITPNWSGETLIPSTGIVALRNSVLDTGLTITFTGTLTALDLFAATTTAPASGATDILTALQAAIDQYATVGPWGFACGPDPVAKSTLALIDAKVQTAFGRDFVQSAWGLRDYAAGESEATWENALIADLQGFAVAHGLGSTAAGPFLHASSYSMAQYRRQAIFAVVQRRAQIPVHQDLGRVRSGPLQRVLWLYHNEDQSESLSAQRVITLRTYPGKPGAFYITTSPTLADPSDVGYSLVEWVSVACGLARNVYAAAFDVVQDDLEVSPIADKAQGNVAGSLSLLAATSVSAPLNRIANAFLFGAKSDGNPSASAFPIGEEPVTVRRTNDFAQDRTVYCDTGFYVRGIAQYIRIPVAVRVP